VAKIRDRHAVISTDDRYVATVVERVPFADSWPTSISEWDYEIFQGAIFGQLKVILEQSLVVHVLETDETRSVAEDLAAYRKLLRFCIDRSASTFEKYHVSLRFPESHLVATYDPIVEIGQVGSMTLSDVVELAKPTFYFDAIESPSGLRTEPTLQIENGYRRSSTEKSRWATAIGPLYTTGGIAAALDWSEEAVKSADECGALLSIPTSEGNNLYPIAQIRPELSEAVRGLQWVLAQLPPKLVDRYMLASWLNKKRDFLDGKSIWDRLRESDEFPDDVKFLVGQFRSALSQ